MITLDPNNLNPNKPFRFKALTETLLLFVRSARNGFSSPTLYQIRTTEIINFILRYIFYATGLIVLLLSCQALFNNCYLRCVTIARRLPADGSDIKYQR